MSNYMNQLAQEVGFPSYETYLESQHWKHFSSKVRSKKCFCCGSSNKLQIHHITYERLGEELPQDVITICHNCHWSVHKAVQDGIVPLDSAHFFVKKHKSKIRQNQVWKPLAKLISTHRSKQDHPHTIGQVIFLLKENNFMDDAGNPTPLAKKRKLFRVIDGKRRWNRKRFYSILKENRKTAQRQLV